MPVVRCSAVSRIAVAALLLSAPIPLLPSGAPGFPAAAQTADDRHVGARGDVLPLRLSLPAEVLGEGLRGNGDRGLLRIGGIPPSCSLNRGFVTAGAWFVSLDDAKNLVLSTPVGFEGTLVLTINLVQAPDREPLRWQVPVEISAPSGTPHRQTAAENFVLGTNAARRLLPAMPDADDRKQLQRAQDLLRSNDVASARLVLKRLANANIAEAAFELARTYDPDFLETVRTSGHTADVAEARKWYGRAARLGHQEAAVRADELRQR